MKSFKKDLLKKSLFRALSILDKKTIRPVLKCIHLSPYDGMIELFATDLEICLKQVIQCNTSLEKNFCIELKEFYELLHEIPEEEIKFSLKDKSLEITGKKLKYTLPLFDETEYPIIDLEPENSFYLNKKILLEGIQKTSYAMSLDEKKVYLNGLFFDFSEKKFKIIGLDGYRLGLFSSEEKVSTQETFILRKKSIIELKKLLEEFEEESFECFFKNQMFCVKFSKEIIFSARVLSRTFPQYQDIIPLDKNFSFEVDKDTLVAALKRLLIVANKNTQDVFCTFSDETLILATEEVNSSTGIEELNVKIEGSTKKLRFNIKYLLESLQPFTSTTIRFSPSDGPVLINVLNTPEYLGVIMPLDA
jgi:DNA polymerase-3 subunit beta